MDRYERYLEGFEKALKRLKEALRRAEKLRGTEEYPFYRDSTIQRFEFTFEIMWKTVKKFLEREGLTCRSPRGCVRELLSTGHISEDLARELFRALEDRNLTFHTYMEEVAEEIMGRMEGHVIAFFRVLEALREEK